MDGGSPCLFISAVAAPDASGNPWLIVALVLLIIGGGYFAASEIAFASVNKVRLRLKAEEGDRSARKAVYIVNNFDRMLTTLLIGNNVMHIACSSVATVLATRLWGATAVTYSTIAITVIVFFASEMLPKTYAKACCERFATGVASSLYLLMKILTPITFIFSGISKLIGKLFASKTEPTVTEDELYDIIDTIEEEGAMDEDKSELIRSALEFDEATVQDVLTSRVDIVAIDSEMTAREVLDVVKREKYSRLPVYRDTIDEMIGVLQVRRFLRAYMRDGDATDYLSMLDAPHFVPRTTNIDELLQTMSARKIHMSFVTDDYGGVLGMLTVEDILEELVGEIWDEDDVVTEDFKKIGGNRFEADADLGCLDAFDMMGYDDFDRDDFRHKTLGAWVLEQFDHMPVEGDRFTQGPLDVTVKTIDHKRIHKLLVRLLDAAQPDAGASAAGGKEAL